MGIKLICFLLLFSLHYWRILNNISRSLSNSNFFLNLFRHLSIQHIVLCVFLFQVFQSTPSLFKEVTIPVTSLNKSSFEHIKALKALEEFVCYFNTARWVSFSVWNIFIAFFAFFFFFRNMVLHTWWQIRLNFHCFWNIVLARFCGFRDHP
jgi:hypothetical protein